MEHLETEFNVAEEPSAADAGKSLTGAAAGVPSGVAPGGLPGDLLCPFCHREMNVATVAEVGPSANSWWQRYLLWGNGLFSYLLNVNLPLRCQHCGPIQYRQLLGESRKTVDRIIRSYRIRFLKSVCAVLLCIGMVASLPFAVKWLRDWHAESRHAGSGQWQQPDERTKQMKQLAEQRQKTREAMEQRRQEQRDRISQEKRERSHETPSAPPLTPEQKAKIQSPFAPDAKPIHAAPPSPFQPLE